MFIIPLFHENILQHITIIYNISRFKCGIRNVIYPGLKWVGLNFTYNTFLFVFLKLTRAIVIVHPSVLIVPPLSRSLNLPILKALNYSFIINTTKYVFFSKNYRH